VPLRFAPLVPLVCELEEPALLLAPEPEPIPPCELELPLCEPPDELPLPLPAPPIPGLPEFPEPELELEPDPDPEPLPPWLGLQPATSNAVAIINNARFIITSPWKIRRHRRCDCYCYFRARRKMASLREGGWIGLPGKETSKPSQIT
jgi:hypothetical protein